MGAPGRCVIGIQKDGNPDSTKWFLKHKAELKVPHFVDIEQHVNIDKYGAAEPLQLKLVKIQAAPPSGFAMKNTRKTEWSKLAVPIEDMSD